jgi:hypothetical protein
MKGDGAVVTCLTNLNPVLGPPDPGLVFVVSVGQTSRQVRVIDSVLALVRLSSEESAA